MRLALRLLQAVDAKFKLGTSYESKTIKTREKSEPGSLVIHDNEHGISQGEATGIMIAAELHDEVSDVHLEMWETTGAGHEGALRRRARSGREDSHWIGGARATLATAAGYHPFAIVCRNELQA